MPQTQTSASTAPRLPLVVAGVRIDRYDPEEAMAAILERARMEPVRVYWVYANCINVAVDDPTYRTALDRAEFVLNDGVGIELAGRLLGRPVVANLVGTDWIPAFLDRLAAAPGAPRRLFLLGARPKVNAAAVAVFAERWPQLEVVGARHGYCPDEEAVLEAIERVRPELLLVAMGVPLQERFLDRHWARLTNAGVRIALAGGAILDYLTGAVPRAPRFWRQARLEWLWRLLHEPRRLGKRYTWGNVRYLARLAGQRLRHGPLDPDRAHSAAEVARKTSRNERPGCR